MEKKDIDWSNLSFGYQETDYSFVSNYKDGKWDEGQLTKDHTITLNECAGVFQYAQTCFEGLKAYTTEDGKIVCFRPDLNAERMKDGDSVYFCLASAQPDASLILLKGNNFLLPNGMTQLKLIGDVVYECIYFDGKFHLAAY